MTKKACRTKASIELTLPKEHIFFVIHWGHFPFPIASTVKCAKSGAKLPWRIGSPSCEVKWHHLQPRLFNRKNWQTSLNNFALVIPPPVVQKKTCRQKLSFRTQQQKPPKVTCVTSKSPQSGSWEWVIGF